MATPTLIATPGSASANSYLTVAEGDTYHDARLSATDWSGASADTRTVALIHATRTLDAMMDWAQHQTDEDQALRWPRQGVVAANELEFIAETEVPQELKNATAEFARQLIVSDTTANSDIETLKIRSLSAGSVALTFDGGVTNKVIPDSVYFLLPEWWFSVNSRVKTVRHLLRG